MDHYLDHVRRKINSRFSPEQTREFVEARSLLRYDKERFLADLQAIYWTVIFDGCNNDIAHKAKMFSSFCQLCS